MRRLPLLLPALMLAALGFADKKDDAKFAPGAASSYATKQTNENVTIGLKPYDNEDLAHTAFGKLNPYQYGILPILVVIQNDTNESLRLDGMRVRYTDYDGQEIDATPAADVPYAVDHPKRPSNPVMLPIPPELRKKHKSPLSGPEIQTRAFAARMLPPHESASGFFYFQAHHRPGASLYVNGITRASSGKELFYFDIPIKE